MAKLFDPLLAAQKLQEQRVAANEPELGDIVPVVKKAPRARAKPLKPPSKTAQLPRELWAATKSKSRSGVATGSLSVQHKAEMIEKKQSRGQPLTLKERIKADFRVFLTLVWRELLGVDPSPIQLDMAYWLQHGPDRTIIMAFRGFSKSWITGAYALWRLYCDPDEKILVVSGSLKRAIATTNWCLELILRMDILADMRPRPSNRQSGQMFDVGNCIVAQSASFMAMGIGGQLVGFRGTCIIPDDVETQQNSLTVLMRDKNKEAVKEFESVLTPGGVIKYLGTPHDLDSLYLDLQKKGYVIRIWPAKFPTFEEARKYGNMLAPYILHHINKHGPASFGQPTMPNRFPLEELAKRELAMGPTEFRLQFMIDLSAGLEDNYSLRFRDLIVMDLDDLKGPEEISWGTSNVEKDLPVMGFDGDFYHGPANVGKTFSPYTKVVGHVDPSGKGKDETALSIVGYLMGRLFWLHLWASMDGFGEPTLRAIAKACVRFRVGLLNVEDNFGGGMFSALLRPILKQEWELANAKVRMDDRGGTEVVDVNSGKNGKEKRIVGILEPVTTSHRLVVNRSVIEWDYKSILKYEGDGKRNYAWGHQFSHMTGERECLRKDDRLDSLAGATGAFIDIMGVDPGGAHDALKAEREEEAMNKLFGFDDEQFGLPSGTSGGKPRDDRMATVAPSKR